MKKIGLLAVFTILLLVSCQEVGPEIAPSGESRVLVEEFTGVHCVNCPEGSAKLEELLDIHGDKLIAVSIHAGFFSDPYNESNYDFRTSEGTQIEALLGPATGWPTASVNRKLFDTESTTLINKDKWAGYIASEKQRTPQVLLSVSKSYDTTTRNLAVSTELRFNETVTDDMNITIMITENNIVDLQLTPDDGVVADYNHKHVLRGMMTPYNGDPYTGSTTVGTTGNMDYNTTLPDGWNAANCHIVAFVSLSGIQKDVLQVTEINIED